MKTLTRRAMGGVAILAFLAAGGYWAYRKMTSVAPQHANLAYGSDPRRVLDVYLPVGPGPFPFVIEIHGGAFKLGDKTANPVQTEILAAEIAVVRINYRFSSAAIWPAQGEDVLAAVQYLRENAASLGLDAARMAVWGQSAGGFLAVSTAISLTEAGKPPRAVVDFYAPMDFSTMDADMTALGRAAAMGQTAVPGSPESQLLGYNVADDPNAARAMGPIGRLEGASLPLPPLFIRHGDGDDFIAHTQSARLAEAWKKAAPAAQVDFALVPGAGHGTSQFGDPAVVGPLVAFLQMNLR